MEVGFSRDKVPSDLGSPWIRTVESSVAWKRLVRQLPWSSRGELKGRGGGCPSFSPQVRALHRKGCE